MASSSVAAVGACRRCDCPAGQAPWDAAYCEFCGHAMGEHTDGTRCRDCDCRGFDGPPDAVFCMACGHSRDHHAGTAATATPAAPTSAGFDVPAVAPALTGLAATEIPDEQETPPPVAVPAAAAVDESTPQRAEEAGCQRCDCEAYVGPPDGVFCMRCGHDRADHRPGSEDSTASEPLEEPPIAAPAAAALVAPDASPPASVPAPIPLPISEPVSESRSTGCRECDCSAFEGPADGVFCMRCGHARSSHQEVGSAAAAPIAASTPAMPTDTDDKRARPSYQPPPAPDRPPVVAPVAAAGSPSRPRSFDRLANWKTVIVLLAVALLIFLGLGIAVFTSSGGSTSNTTTPSSPTTTSSGGTATAQSTPGGFTVSRIAGGDVLWLNKGAVKVRLVQVDAPDIATNDCYSSQAAAALAKLTPVGTTVTMKRDPLLAAQDPFGRELRYVYVDGQNVNLALAKQGALAPYFFFGQRGRYARQLLRDARQAKRAGSGLWGACPGTQLDPNHEVHTRQ